MNYLSRRQAAKACGRCDKTMRRLASRGEGPPFLLMAGRPLYPADKLQAWIAANTMGGAK
ncbi:helix-turn-helix domain-containing protein [Bradyrhizobium sp. SZCCHNPS2010]|uniref:helix-turn-helix domain-containing protein n=1 Tax=Bradyrhizobium sp. SZCCHNPS2010 TaxID=3057333 RepID=UPI0039672CDE